MSMHDALNRDINLLSIQNLEQAYLSYRSSLCSIGEENEVCVIVSRCDILGDTYK